MNNKNSKRALLLFLFILICLFISVGLFKNSSDKKQEDQSGHVEITADKIDTSKPEEKAEVKTVEKLKAIAKEITDPYLAGNWKTVDHLLIPRRYNTVDRQYLKDFPLTRFIVFPDGKTSYGKWHWSENAFIHPESKIKTKYDLRLFGDKFYLFLYWDDIDKHTPSELRGITTQVFIKENCNAEWKDLFRQEKDKLSKYFRTTEPIELFEKENGEAEVKGEVTSKAWGSFNIQYNIADSEYRFYMASVKFRIDYLSDDICLFLRLPSGGNENTMCYQDAAQESRYSSYYYARNTGGSMICGSRYHDDFGNEDNAYHRQRIIFDRKLQECSFWVDDFLLGILKFTDNDEPPSHMSLLFQAVNNNTKLNFSFKDISVKAFGKYTYTHTGKSLYGPEIF